MKFQDVVRQRLDELGVSPITAARSSGLHRDAIRGILRGRSPSVEKAAQVCAALGLEFYVGPPPAGERSLQLTPQQRATVESAVEILMQILDQTGEPGWRK